LKIFNSLGAIAAIVFAAVLLSSMTPANGNRPDRAGQRAAVTDASFGAPAPVALVLPD
jgi:fucose permease